MGGELLAVDGDGRAGLETDFDDLTFVGSFVRRRGDRLQDPVTASVELAEVRAVEQIRPAVLAACDEQVVRQRLGAYDRSVGCDLWNPSGLCGADAAPAGVGVSAAGNGVHARFCDCDGRDRIFQHDWGNRRRRQPRVPPGRDAGGLHLFAAWIVRVQRAELFFRLEEAAVEEEIRSVCAGSSG